MMKQRRLLIVVLVIFMLIVGTLVYLASQGFWNETADSSPDIIIHNGEILTMEQSPGQVKALAIQGEYIVAVGDENDILAMAGANTQFIDLEGRTLLPGFNDAHCHWFHDLSWIVNISTTEEAIETVLRSGWTSVSELFADQDCLSLLRSLDNEGGLRVRVNAYLPLSRQFERFGDWYQAYQPGQEFSSKLRIGGVKIFMDGTFDEYDHFFDQTELDSLVLEAHEAGFQIAIHSIIHNATDIALNSLESVLGGQSNHLYRHRIEHLVLLRNDQIQRMSDLGIIASFQLTWHNSDYLQAPVFSELHNRGLPVARWRDILQAGIPSLGSTDFPWNWFSISSSMKTISRAVTRIGELGLLPTAQMLNQTLSVEQALRLITIDAAYGTFQEDIKGSIKVGKLADLVMLSDNPLTVPESSLADIEVLMTMVGGVVEYSAPDLQILSNDNILISFRTIEESRQLHELEMVDQARFELASRPLQ
ncbi:MAG: amidohydrolase [Candidatus Thorarchaeota archaeon]